MHLPKKNCLPHHFPDLHFLELGGEKALCLGGDLDGCGTLAAGMQGVQDMPRLWQALAARGYSQALLEDLFWNNLRSIL